MDSRSACRSLLAEARAGPELSHRPGLRLWLHRLYRLAVADRQQDAAVLQFRRPRQLCRSCWALPHWWRAISNLAIFAIALYRHLQPCWASASRSCSTRRSAAKGLLRPIYLYPMALSFIVTGTAWKWFLDPGIGLENTMHLWGWESFSFNWIKDRQLRDLLRRDRRGLAVLRLRHGDVPGRPARRRQRDHQGGADRRRLHPRPSTAASSSR